MTLREQLLLIADTFVAARGLSKSRVSTIVFNDGKALARIEANGDIYTANFERALTWFSTNWPAGTAWPDGIDRPVSEHVEAAE